MEASDSSIQGFIFLLASPKRRPSAILLEILVPFPLVFRCHEVTKWCERAQGITWPEPDPKVYVVFTWSFIALIFFMPRTNKALITWPSVVLFYKKRVERYWSWGEIHMPATYFFNLERYPLINILRKNSVMLTIPKAVTVWSPIYTNLNQLMTEMRKLYFYGQAHCLH